MIQLREILKALEEMAPLHIAESWDNVGLLLGDSERRINRVMTCLTVTEETVQEAIDTQVNLIVSHHPLPFKPLNRITSANLAGRLLLRCAENKIAIYSPHTAWDNAAEGINWQLATALKLKDIQPISVSAGIDKPSPASPVAQSIASSGTLPATSRLTSSSNVASSVGQGRMGHWADGLTLGDVRQLLTDSLGPIAWRSTHEASHRISKVGIICGSGGSYWSEAAKRGCDAFLTGEATYHQCLEAESNGVAMLMIGHFASEFFSMKKLAAQLAASFDDLQVECSQREHSQF